MVDVLRVRLVCSELKVRLRSGWSGSGFNAVWTDRHCVGCCCHDTHCRIIARPIRKLLRVSGRNGSSSAFRLLSGRDEEPPSAFPSASLKVSVLTNRPADPFLPLFPVSSSRYNNWPRRSVCAELVWLWMLLWVQLKCFQLGGVGFGGARRFEVPVCV